MFKNAICWFREAGTFKRTAVGLLEQENNG
jgi:hypothetical protein